ncbi:hypothetical protein V9T40_003130 [Parthenolecanium corni]|uniref:EIF-4F 25 kDa subunit n=1 Tax=Parthenolecanium corni TaxID=536013 RepID=A0AAN9TRZ3_9HEMI
MDLARYDSGSKNDDDSHRDDDMDLNDIQSADRVIATPLTIPPDHHKLQYQYWLWFSKRWKAKVSTVTYDQNLKLIGKFGSVEQFWAIYGHLVRPSELPSQCDFHLFKLGIKPMWEDEANSKGGQWIVRLKKGLVSRCWENLILAMLGEQFMVGDELCGSVVSTRLKEDIITVWNRTASDISTTTRIRDTLRRIMNLPPNTSLEYKTHNDILKHLPVSHS